MEQRDELRPTGWSPGAFLLGSYWYLRHGLQRKGRLLLVPHAVTLTVLISYLGTTPALRTQDLLDRVAAGMGALIIWSFFGMYCAARFPGDYYDSHYRQMGRTPPIPTAWHWGAFFLSGAWYYLNGMRLRGLVLLLAFVSSLYATVSIPLGIATAYGVMCYGAANFTAEKFLEFPPPAYGPTPQEEWMLRDLARALAPLRQVTHPSLWPALFRSIQAALRSQGYSVEVVTGDSPRLADLVIARDGRKLVVRAAVAGPAPVTEVENLLRALETYRAPVGVLATAGPLTPEAQRMTEQEHVRVLNLSGPPE
jgi:hypothetical protein